jgi:hypothetical protein
MTFIPERKLRIGQRVHNIVPLETMQGLFTVDHRFKITGIGVRGYDLIDENGNECIETGFTSVVDDGGD